MDPTPVAAAQLARDIMSQRFQDWARALESCTEDCLLDTDDLRVKGKTRIAKVLRFTCSICKSSGVVGDPVFDPESNTIAYTYFRHLKLGSKITQKTVLHLRPASPDEPTGKQVVYAIGDPKLNMRITSMPILGPMWASLPYKEQTSAKADHSQLLGFRMLMSGFILFVASIMELFTSPFERVTRDAPQDAQVNVENGADARR